MPNWNYKIDVRDAWRKAQNDEITPAQFCTEVVDALKKLPPGLFSNSALGGIYNDLQSCAANLDCDANDFDEIWERLYDWADDYRCWIGAVI